MSEQIDPAQLTRAAALVVHHGKASTSFVQRHLGIGFNAASRLMERMEEMGIISAPDHVGKREVATVETIRAAIEIGEIARKLPDGERQAFSAAVNSAIDPTSIAARIEKLRSCGKMGASACAIAAHLGGYGPICDHHPHDADDFARCELLLMYVPEFEAQFSHMATVSPYWAVLVPHLTDLRATPREKRSAAMRVILDPITDADPNTIRLGPGVTATLHTQIVEGMRAAHEAQRTKEGKPKMKPDPTFDEAADNAYAVTVDELRQFVERFEQLESEKKDITEQQKEVMAEAKGRGYDTKVLKKIIALRKRKADDIAEEEAVLELYKQALGMA